MYSIMFEAENVLVPSVIQEMFRMSEKIRSATFKNTTWNDVCLRVPIVSPPRCLNPQNKDQKLCEDFKFPSFTSTNATAFKAFLPKMIADGFSLKLGTIFIHPDKVIS